LRALALVEKVASGDAAAQRVAASTEQGAAALPATAKVVSAYQVRLSSIKSTLTVRRRLAAIRLAWAPLPTEDAIVHTAIKDARRHGRLVWIAEPFGWPNCAGCWPHARTTRSAGATAPYCCWALPVCCGAPNLLPSKSPI
jgi:hypothetical protein